MLVLALGCAPGRADAEVAREWGAITVDNGVLTLDVASAPLDAVLRAIATEAGFDLHVRGDLTSPITARLAPRPLAAGLVRLLRGHSTSLTYVRGPDGREAIERLVVVAAEPSPRLLAHRNQRLAHIRRLPGMHRGHASGTLRTILRGDGDPVVRAAAARAFGRVGGGLALTELTRALGDAAPSVRVAAAHALLQASPPNAGAALAARLPVEPDAGVRREIASLLGRVAPSAEVRAALEAAASDASPAVRREASRALARWSARSR
jgi:hypothetical protein